MPHENVPMSDYTGPMSYQDLLEWVKTMGKTEDDVINWWAFTDVEAVRDMTDAEMVEWLKDGVKYDSAYVKRQWEELEEEAKLSYQRYMIYEWSKQGA